MKQFRRNKIQRIEWMDELVKVEFEKSKQQAMLGCGGEMFLYVEFTTFEYPVIFNQASHSLTTPKNYVINDPLLIPDVQDEQNPIEMKYLKLAHRTTIYDRDLKPDQSERSKIDVRIHKIYSVNNQRLFILPCYFLSIIENYILPSS